MRRLLAVLLVVALAGGAWWWWSRARAGGFAPGLQGVASAAPAEARLFTAVDLRGRVDLAEQASALDGLLQSAPRLREQVQEAEKRLGLTLKEMALWAEPVGYAALIPREHPITKARDGGKPVDGVLALGLKDEAAALTGLKALLEKRQGPAMDTVPIGGSEFRMGGAGPYRWGVGIHRGLLLVGSGEEVLTKAVDAADGRAPRLGADPGWNEALETLPGDSTAVAWLALKPLLSSLAQDPAASEAVDSEIRRALEALEFGVMSFRADGSSQAFLRVDPQSEAPLAKALLDLPAAPLATAGMVPVEWGTFSALNLRWLWNVVFEIAKLVPEARMVVKMAPIGIYNAIGYNPEDTLWDVLTGEIGYSNDSLKQLPGMMDSRLGQARDQGRLTACRSNLKNLGTACEMWSTDHEGRYPARLQELAPDYLRAVPTCPSAGSDTYTASYQVRQGPDWFRIACRGHHHAGAGLGPDRPAFNSQVGLEDFAMEKPQASPPSPNFVVLLALKDRAAAERVVQTAEGKAGVRPSPGEGGVVLYPGLPVARLFLEKPAPTLALAIGPDGPARLAMVAQAAAGKVPAVAANPRFQKAAQAAGERWAAVNWADLRPLVEALRGLVKSVDDPGPEAGEALGMLDKMLAGSEVGETASSTWVTAEGVRNASLEGPSTETFAFAAGVGAAVLVPNFIRARAQGQLTACKSNLKNVGTGLEMWSTDQEGRYPARLEELKPNYLRAIPTCPSAGSDTYSQGYESSGQAYTVRCSGTHHRAVGIPADFPRYTSTEGLQDGR